MTKGRIHSLESFGTVDGPGVRFVVFTQGCPLRCAYCHNPDTWSYSSGNLMEPQYIIEQYERNKSYYNSGGITVTGGEPLLQIDFLIDLFTLAKQQGIHTCIDTSGIIFKENNIELIGKLDRLMSLTDLVMLDIKHIDHDAHLKLTSLSNIPVLAFLKYLSERNISTWVRHVVVPGITDKEEDLFNLGYHIGCYTNIKALDVLPYHTMGTSKYEQLGIPYPLEGVPAMEKATAVELKKIVISGIKKKRIELGLLK